MSKVRSIQVINGQGSLFISEGQNGIDRIEDKSLEYEDSFYSMYLCYDKDNHLVKSVENCPIVVDYYNDQTE